MDHLHNDPEPFADAVSVRSKAAAAAPKAGPTPAPITGLTPPELGEALVRECRPTLLAALGGGPARLAGTLTRTVVLAPLGWLLLAPLFALKFVPFLGKRYTLTNRRLLVRGGVKLPAAGGVPLADIDDVRQVPGSYDPFYHAGTLEVLSGGQVRLTLPAVPEPEGFRQAVLNTCAAWAPGRARAFAPFVPASGEAPAKAPAAPR